MTNEKIRQYRHILREIPALRKEIAELRGRAVVTHDTVKASLTEAPYTMRDIAVEIPEALPDVRDMLAIKRRRLQRIIQQRKLVEQYIDSIEDSYIRQLVILRATTDLNWNQIADQVGGSSYSAKHAYYRHLQDK